jgi:site-specific recombinase XerD
VSPAVAVVIWPAISTSSAAKVAATMPPGADLRTAHTLPQHANLNTTAIYTQVSAGKRVEAIDQLDPFA